MVRDYGSVAKITGLPKCPDDTIILKEHRTHCWEGATCVEPISFRESGCQIPRQADVTSRPKLWRYVGRRFGAGGLLAPEKRSRVEQAIIQVSPTGNLPNRGPDG